MSNEFVARKGLISLQTSSFKEDVYISGSLRVGTFATSSKLTLSGSAYISKGLVVDGGITGSLYGTSSWAISSSYALNSLYSTKGVKWTIQTASYTMYSGERVLADTSAGPFTITLPSSPSPADYLEINDRKAPGQPTVWLLPETAAI